MLCSAVCCQQHWQHNRLKSLNSFLVRHLLSHFFDVKNISVVNRERIGTDESRYVHQLNGFPPFSEEEQETLLIVDDIVDTGRTLEVVRQVYPKAKIVTLSAKPAGQDKVDCYSILVPQNTWIVFPWEVNSDSDQLQAHRSWRALAETTP